MRFSYLIGTLALAVSLLLAQTGARAPVPRFVPPLAKAAVPPERLAAFRKELERLENELKPFRRHAMSPDVEVFLKAVRYALINEEFYGKDETKIEWALGQADARLKQLKSGNTPWVGARGTVVRGLRSAIDGSIQPYVVTVPANLDLSKPTPLYLWLHGRGDTLTDLHFIYERSIQGPQGPMVDPVDRIILEPFGRQSLGWKSTGERDIFEALEQIRQPYRIDEDRIILTGYSMGGAGAWHIGAHYTDYFCAVQPGAGFVDVERYQAVTPDKYPVWYERTLWGLYDVPDYVMNLFNVPVVAYNGEIDKQRESGEIMADLFRKNGRSFPHIIGPGLAHVPARGALLKQVLAELEPSVKRGRNRFPQEVFLQTRTLRYNQMHWVEILSLDEHWRDTRVTARRAEGPKVELVTSNVHLLRLSPPEAGTKEFPAGFEIVINGSSQKTRSARNSILIDAEAKTILETAALPKTGKRHGLQGPIDDVLLAPFLVVEPSGKSRNAAVQQWVEFELDHLIRRWRTLYRAELPVKKDTEVTDRDIKDRSLILFGDPDSNLLIRRALPGLPIRWTTTSMEIAGRKFAADSHVPLLIYPDPLNRDRYVVLNSGPTHREAHDHTNSLQNPKLPDWAIIDISTPPSAEAPGKAVAADFFDELWQVKPQREAVRSAGDK